ncbi:hypothetical protein Tco_0261256 [Tanacetum coccineum]
MQIMRPVMNAEIKISMFDIGDDKALGLDVYTSMFFKKGRDVVDNLFIFAHGDVDSAGVIMASLNKFRKVSGLVRSIPKSKAHFCNVLNHVKMAILNIMPFSKGFFELYLLIENLIYGFERVSFKHVQEKQ